MGLFGFGKKNGTEKVEKWRDTMPWNIFKNIDYLDENNEPYLRVIEGVMVPKTTYMPDGTLVDFNSAYYVMYNFLSKVLNEEAAIFLTGRKLETVDGYAVLDERETNKIVWYRETCYRFLEAWNIIEILNSDNGLVRYFKNPQFIKVANYFSECHLDLFDFNGFYNLYVHDEEFYDDVTDDSILFYPEFVVMCGKENEKNKVENLLEIYRELKNDHELRNKILYKDDTYLRSYTYIMMDYAKYKETSIKE